MNSALYLFYTIVIILHVIAFVGNVLNRIELTAIGWLQQRTL